MMFKKNTTAQRRPARRLVPRKTIHAKAASSREEVEEYEGESEPSMKLYQAFIVVLVLHVVAVAGIYGFNRLKEKPAAAIAAKPAAPDAAVETAASGKKETSATKTQAAANAKTVDAQATYTVMAGDTLRRIASKFNTSIESIEKANNLTSTSVIKVGQVLAIGASAKAANAGTTPESTSKTAPTPAVVAKAPPVKQATAEEKAEAKPVEKTKSTEEKTHVVAKGDNPYSLAKKYNITQAALMKANNIDDPKKLKIGQKLIIP